MKLSFFCEDVKMNYKTKCKEIILQVNMDINDLIEKFKLEDKRDPYVNIYVGVKNVDGNNVISYVTCDYHTCDGDYWYDLDYTFSDDENKLLYNEMLKRIR